MPPAGSNSINVYVNAAAINLNTAPVVQITGSNTTLSSPAQIAVNKSNTKVEVFIANTGGSNIPVYSDLGSASASGNATPSRNISGASSLVLPVGIALDTTR
jgi:flagellar capping protein FliD